MRRIAMAHVLLALAVSVSGCASAPVVPVRGTPSQLAGIAGEWDGTYSSRATGRSGSIWFKLVEGEDHAHGDVMITAAGATSPFRRYVPERYPYLQGPRPAGQSAVPDTFLTIRFVRASDGRIDGVLDPYWDPACTCQVITAFRGDVRDGRIVGTFVSRFGESIATGQWEAARRSPGKR